MRQTTDAYNKLVQSTIRPKIVPHIKLYNENGLVKEWASSNITSMKYSSGLDILGREMPYIELTWEEITTDESVDIALSSLVYQKVKVTFEQKLSFFNNWKTVYESSSWKDIYSGNWKQLRNETIGESFEMPALFLSATPKIERNKIKWTARDILYFLNGDFYDAIGGEVFKINNDGTGTTRSWIYLDDLYPEFVKQGYKYPFNGAVEQSAINLANFESRSYYGYGFDYNRRVVANEPFNSFLVKLLNVETLYITFNNKDPENDNMDGSLSVNPLPDSIVESDLLIPTNVMYNYPEIINEPNISSYMFKIYSSKDAERKITIVPDSETPDSDGKYTYTFPELAWPKSGDNPSNWTSLTSINYKGAKSNYYGDLVITPLEIRKTNAGVDYSQEGEQYNEDNPYMIYRLWSQQAHRKRDILKNYFSNDPFNISVTMLPDFRCELADVSLFEVNNYNNIAQERCIITKIEYEYNGAFKQKIHAHKYTMQ